jgi:hypothetical protein
MMQQIIDSELAEKDNAVLDAAGLYDCRVAIGFYRKGNANFDHEARLIGGSSVSREKAKILLPHITFSE